MAARFAIDEPSAELAVQSVLRAAQSASLEDLADVAARARSIATLHGSWPAWVAAAVAHRRLGRWTAARAALEVAVEIAPGAALAHVELAEALLALGDLAGAIEHAERARSLEGESPRATAVLAKARAPVATPWYARLRDTLARLVLRRR